MQHALLREGNVAAAGLDGGRDDLAGCGHLLAAAADGGGRGRGHGFTNVAVRLVGVGGLLLPVAERARVQRWVGLLPGDP